MIIYYVISVLMLTLSMNHPAVHDPGNDAVVQFVHFEGDALEDTQRLDLNTGLT